MTDSDPGWGQPKDIALAAFAALAPKVALRQSDPHALVTLRTVFVSFVSSGVLIGAVAVFLFASGDTASASVSVAAACGVVALVGVGAVIASRFIQASLPCGTHLHILNAYRTRFFLRMAFSNSAALVGFVGCFLADSPVPYAVGLVFAAVGYAMAAPTAAHLLADDDAMRAQGCDSTLTEAFGISAGPADPIS